MEGTVFAANLERLMAYAAKHHDKRLASPEALEEASGVSRSNIYRYLAQETSPTLEKLEGIARAFDLMAWQLLVPHLDPANPPVVFVTPEERALYDSIRTVGLQARNLEGAIATDTVTSPAGPDTHRTTKTTLKKRGRPAKTRFP